MVAIKFWTFSVLSFRKLQNRNNFNEIIDISWNIPSIYRDLDFNPNLGCGVEGRL